MKRWVVRIILLVVVGITASLVYAEYRAGTFSLPDLPNGAYHIAFENGLRAIVLDADVADRTGDDAPRYFRMLSVANGDRRYLGFPFDVEPWFKDVWSWCKAPTAEEQSMLETLPDEIKRRYQNARFEAVCKIDVDGTDILRGLIFSVPKL